VRQATVFYKGAAAGLLTQNDDASFSFRYTDTWFQASDKPAVCLALPKTSQAYKSPHLFACFYNMLPEGANKQSLCFRLRIDEADHFSLLMHVAHSDCIGALTIRQVNTDATA